ncbi:hypothetical protein LEP1GSC132_2238 [Leptospira kirschneri str. 200803703]|uniref:Uncharacterized protein n=1 Tax=Leptospira kirschneri str. 200802841 TaxID=1193047 RepID=A0A828XXJ1_9LEPT|nr:hypothetical protein LEP1GSC131_1296 [Leptospira kirschneri str. 200802841]EMK15089.1 hypothetical protein LEP1GSC042_2763 [Leptospira kirschneri serovar Bim str. PUO 1247]EMN06325.1 hypothetical protein LEP1GSC046_1215 [Leptospira kirschneri serovar Bim str. 1051]EMO68108.1 hypothetical protein LEP1GSC132_2238 [Leptospira kirschneri str. 200803703]EMO76591.1 hypothetical protein LEP1GSC127_1415 [Leptospira kirschneri str. 200801925]EPG49233.1 hypothetical protein LEP1GSC049_1470 [Leptospir
MKNKILQMQKLTTQTHENVYPKRTVKFYKNTEILKNWV